MALSLMPGYIVDLRRGFKQRLSEQTSFTELTRKCQ